MSLSTWRQIYLAFTLGLACLLAPGVAEEVPSVSNGGDNGEPARLTARPGFAGMRILLRRLITRRVRGLDSEDTVAFYKLKRPRFWMGPRASNRVAVLVYPPKARTGSYVQSTVMAQRETVPTHALAAKSVSASSKTGSPIVKHSAARAVVTSVPRKVVSRAGTGGTAVLSSEISTVIASTTRAVQAREHDEGLVFSGQARGILATPSSRTPRVVSRMTNVLRDQRQQGLVPSRGRAGTIMNGGTAGLAYTRFEAGTGRTSKAIALAGKTFDWALRTARKTFESMDVIARHTPHVSISSIDSAARSGVASAIHGERELDLFAKKSSRGPKRKEKTSVAMRSRGTGTLKTLSVERELSTRTGVARIASETKGARLGGVSFEAGIERGGASRSLKQIAFAHPIKKKHVTGETDVTRRLQAVSRRDALSSTAGRAALLSATGSPAQEVLIYLAKEWRPYRSQGELASLSIPRSFIAEIESDSVVPMELQKTVNKHEAANGDIVVFEIRARNQGTVPLERIVILDVLSKDLRVVESLVRAETGTVQVRPRNDGTVLLQWNVERAVAPGEFVALKFPARVVSSHWAALELGGK